MCKQKKQIYSTILAAWNKLDPMTTWLLGWLVDVI